MIAVRREPGDRHSRSTAEKRLCLIIVMLAMPIVAWVAIALAFWFPDGDPRSPGHYIAVFYGGIFGLLVMIKTDDWRWQWSGALAGVAIGLAYTLLH